MTGPENAAPPSVSEGESWSGTPENAGEMLRPVAAPPEPELPGEQPESQEQGAPPSPIENLVSEPQEPSSQPTSAAPEQESAEHLALFEEMTWPEAPAQAGLNSAALPGLASVAPAPPSAPLPAGAPDLASPSYSTDPLEEETYAPTIAAAGPKAGDIISDYQLNEDLGRGWFVANPVDSGPSVDVYVRPEPLWAGLLPHQLLPSTVQHGQLTVLEPVQGVALQTPLAPQTARDYLTSLARLLFALEKQGYAVVDLDPASVQLTGSGLKLRFPPKVAYIGQVTEPVLREGLTPPEVQAGAAVDPKSGVYLLGALLYQWLTGQTLPAEGPSAITLAGVGVSGMPQLLHRMLAPLPGRFTPTELLSTLRETAVSAPLYQVAATTDIGLNPERPINEDAYGFLWRQTGQHGGGEVNLRAVVSDGMGGMAAGEVASQAAVRGFLNSAQPTPEQQIWDANAAVLADMNGRDGGCTISAVEIRGEALYLGHVGDTRAYLAAHGQVTQLSKDHSYVAAMVASGQMTPEEAQRSPERNKVLRSLGSLRTPQENYVQTLDEPLTLAVGSRVLLVSDGVWGEVEPNELSEILLSAQAPQDVTDRLIALSLQRGAPDNVTALVIERVN